MKKSTQSAKEGWNATPTWSCLFRYV